MFGVMTKTVFYQNIGFFYLIKVEKFHKDIKYFDGEHRMRGKDWYISVGRICNLKSFWWH